MTNWGAEIAKIALQVTGAGVVSVITVKLAFSRYKNEKLWEKHFTVYDDIVSALRQLRATLNKWEDHFNGECEISDEERERLRDKYSSEKERLFDALSTGAIVLPIIDVAAIHVLFERLEDRNSQSLEVMEALKNEINAIQNCYDYFIPVARKAIGSRELGRVKLFRTPVLWLSKNFKL